MRKLMMAAAAVATLGMAIGPGVAQAQRYYDRAHHRYYWRCKAGQHRDTTTGTVLGAIGGGLLGHAIGGRGAGGTIVGAGVGAYAGHEIARSNHPC